jgi:hypothetical protein
MNAAAADIDLTEAEFARLNDEAAASVARLH